MNHNSGITKDTRYKPCLTSRGRPLSSQSALMTYPTLGFFGQRQSREDKRPFYTSDCTIREAEQSY